MAASLMATVRAINLAATKKTPHCAMKNLRQRQSRKKLVLSGRRAPRDQPKRRCWKAQRPRQPQLHHLRKKLATVPDANVDAVVASVNVGAATIRRKPRQPMTSPSAP